MKKSTEVVIVFIFWSIPIGIAFFGLGAMWGYEQGLKYIEETMARSGSVYELEMSKELLRK